MLFSNRSIETKCEIGWKVHWHFHFFMMIEKSSREFASEISEVLRVLTSWEGADGGSWEDVLQREYIRRGAWNWDLFFILIIQQNGKWF